VVSLACSQCQSQGFSVTDLVSIVLAGAAFFVSVASLYLTSLRRPDIDVDPVRHGYEIAARTYSGDMLSGASIDLQLFMANTGSTGTVLESLSVEYEENNTVARIWSGWASAPDMPIALPLAFERDDASSTRIRRMLGWNNDPAIPDADELARRLRGLESLTVTLRWSYRRPGLLQPRRRESHSRSSAFDIDGATIRNQVLGHWRGNVFYAHLADIVEPPDPLEGPGDAEQEEQDG
jgi:hypothetical protein